MIFRQQYDDRDAPKETWARALKVGYDEVAQEPMPDRFRQLLKQLEEAEALDREPMTGASSRPAWLTRPPRDR